MDEHRPFYRDPNKQIIIAVFIVAVLYVYLMGRQGSAMDVAYRDGYAYIAMGNDGGMRIVDVLDPGSPREAAHFNFLGTAKRITLADRYLLVADGQSGMRILDVSKPRSPVLDSTFYTPGDTRDIAVAGHFAYLAKGNSGVTIVDFSDPTRPVGVKTISLPDAANAVQALQISNTQPPTVEGQPSETSLSTYLYIANGARGIQVIDVTLATAPVVMGGVDTPGVALDIAISGPYAYVADSSGGLRVESLANPIQPVEIGSMQTSGSANKVSLNGPYVLVAKGDHGVSVVNVANPTVPVEALNYAAAGNVLSAAGLGPFLLLAEGQQGVSIVNISNSSRPEVLAIYDTPGEASLLQVLQGIWSAAHQGLADVHAKVWLTLVIMFADLVLLVLGLLFWLGFYAQFSLPLHTVHDRVKAFGLMTGYYLGVKGPALFIENGKLVEREREQLRYGPGVAILDTASAAVFRTRHAFTRPAGPGIIFTNPGEYPAGVVDLHQQSVSLGPVDKEGVKEDPFADKAEDEVDLDYNQRQGRRYETSGLTRDGVEVVPDVSVSFKLDSVAGEGKTQFGYDAQSVWKAIAGVGIQLDAEPGSDQRYVSWDWLPGHIAVDLWREYVRKYTLIELYASPDPQNNKNGSEFQSKTAYEKIVELVRARMTKEEVDEVNDIGEKTGNKVHSREFQILKQRGIKILSVNIHSLRFPEKVEKQLVDQWVATWLQRAQKDLSDSENVQAKERNKAQEQALKDFATNSSQILADELLENLTLGTNKSLELLVQGTLKVCIRELELNPKINYQKTSLTELVEWIRKQKS